jgi:putative tryptophan/tyrosine transport system substrate-binding protein
VAIFPIAQQTDHMQRVAVLSPLDADAQSRVSAFVKELSRLAWIDGRSRRIDIRWRRVHAHATELFAILPNVIFAAGNSSGAPSLQASQAVPIVFAIL